MTPFNILTNLRYKKVKFVKDQIVIRSSKVGLGRDIKKSHVFIFGEEKLMFNQTLCQKNSPLGVNMHFTFFAHKTFSYRTTTKVQSVDKKTILVVLATYLVLKYLLFQNYIQFLNYWFFFKKIILHACFRYCLNISRNWHLNAAHYGVDNH
jgi:hypothetical protein